MLAEKGRSLAVNKRKILESAQKHLQRGALDKALEDYQTLLKADSKDSNIRLKVGDLHLKLGRSQDAIDAYMRVAQQFTNEGFDAKAVALYKQITKLDEKRFEVHAQLGDLYQRMGLTSEAMKAIQLAADGAHRTGDKPQAMNLLRRMAALDPTNTSSRLKVANLLAAEGKPEDALSEYDEVVKELERQHNTEEQVKVLERALELAPERLETLRPLARAALESGAGAKAESAARAILAAAPDDLEALELLGTVLERDGRAEDAATAFRRLAERFRARGEDERARELIQRYGAGDAFEVPDSEPPVIEGDASDLELDPELDASLGLDDSAEFELGGDTGKAVAVAALEDATLEPSAELVDDTSEVAEFDSAADVDQLLAEASVFSRYGKHERAIETLRAALRAEPSNGPALEKLGESLIAIGNRPHASSSLQRAATAFTQARDAAGLERVRALLAPLDAKAAAALVALAPALPEAAAEAEPEAEHGEIDIDIDDGFDDDPAPAAAEAVAESPVEGDFSGIEIDVSGDLADDEAVLPAPAKESSPTTGNRDDEFTFDSDDSSDALEVAASGALPPAQTEAEPTSVSAAAVEADFEEAEFYREQGLTDEARALYERVLSIVPNHPRAQLRLGELEAPREAPAPSAVASAVETEIAFDLDLPATAPQIAEQPAAESEEPEDDTTPQVVPAVPSVAPILKLPAPLADPAPVPKILPPAPAPSVPTVAVEAAAEPELLGGADFDLAAELSGAFDEGGATRGDTKRGDGHAFEEVFAAFKAGVKREVADGDTEAHYDLGIAYREMGLFEDAIGEFRVALQSPARALASLHLMAMCALDLGRCADAIANLSEALATGPLPAEQEAALRIDLGRAHQAAGDRGRARAEFEAARTSDPGFAGVDELLAALEAAPDEPAVAASGETFESFDDLVESDAVHAPPPAAAAPQYESFDELIDGDAEPHEATAEPEAEAAMELSAAEDATPEGPAAPVAAPAAAPIDEPREIEAPPSAKPEPAAPPPAAPGRRKKKISFV